jgi:hypothetical protein
MVKHREKIKGDNNLNSSYQPRKDEDECQQMKTTKI